MSRLVNTVFSVLDLSSITQGGTPADALHRTLDLARHAEAWGYHRYWVAEHHSMPGIASAATSVVIGYVAGGTSRIRVGSGGVMLPNHAPLVIAEQFGTMESLYPGRIDLGLGRAPGTDPLTALALRRDGGARGEDFPDLLEELRSFLRPVAQGQKVRAVPGAGSNIPIWLLGSGGFSAQLAGQLGLPFGFAAHFSPGNLVAGLDLYRRSFRPSELLREPYAMVGVNVIAADTDEEARRLATSHQQSHLSLIRGMPRELPPPVDDMSGLWSPGEQAAVESTFLRTAAVGNPETVRARLEWLAETTQAEEFIVHTMVYDHTARLRSYELVSEIAELQRPRAGRNPSAGL